MDVESLLNYVKPILIDRILTEEYAQKDDIPLEDMYEKGDYKVPSVERGKQLKIDEKRTTNVLTTVVRTIVNVLTEHKPYFRNALVSLFRFTFILSRLSYL
jgi:hypothetical protein